MALTSTTNSSSVRQVYLSNQLRRRTSKRPRSTFLKTRYASLLLLSFSLLINIHSEVYYDYFTTTVYRGTSKGKEVTVPAELHQIPLLIRGGSILATKERPRRASTAMKLDPYTIRVALDKSGNAKGELYIDDGDSYDYRKDQPPSGYAADHYPLVIDILPRDTAN